jgi:hypothetical protein
MALSTGSSVVGGAKFVDENGLLYGVRHVDNKPRVSAMPYAYDIAEGNIANHTAFEVFGYNGDIDVTAEDVISQGGTYSFPSGAAGMQLISTSVEDDPDKGGAVAGTGIQSVTLYYLTTGFVEKSEDVNLNGVAAATTTATDIYRVIDLHAKTCGTGGSAAGTISLQSVGGGTTYSQIEVGNTRSRSAVTTVPTGKVLYVTSWSVGCVSTTANNGARATLRATYDRKAAASRTFFLPYAEISIIGFFDRKFEVPLKFVAGTDVKVSSSSLANNAVVSTCIRGWIETT